MRIKQNHRHPAKHPRGTAMVMGIIVSVVLTGLIMTLAWSNGLMTVSTTGKVALNQAFFVAESGAQRALWQWKHNSYTWNSTGTWTMTVYDSTSGRSSVAWTQTYSCVPDPTAPNYDISCTASLSGSSGTTNAATCAFVAAPPSAGVPTLSGGANANISGVVKVTGSYLVSGTFNTGNNLTITGSLTTGGALTSAPIVNGDCLIRGDLNAAVQVGGDLSITGSANNAGATVAGDFTYAANLNSAPTVAGKTTHGAVTITIPTSTDPGQQVSSIISTLQPQGTVISGTSTVLDFTQNNKGILVVSGDANFGTVTFIGTGTLIVTGNWNQSKDFGSAVTPAGMNLVIGGSVNSSPKGLYISGSLYVASNWQQKGPFSIGGVALVNGDETVSGDGTLGGAPPPSFDNRAGASGGSTTIQISSFHGPVL